jgi:hypothetical protein
MEAEFAAFVAIDWADQKHAWTLQAGGLSAREAGEIDHTPEAMEVWASKLRLRFGGRTIAVALEQSRGPLVFMLTKYDHLVIFPVIRRRWQTTARAFGHLERRTIQVTQRNGPARER